MRLLIKLYIDNINFYDLEQIIGALNNSITEEDTRIIIMTNDKKIKFDSHTVYYQNEYSVPIMINYKLSQLGWDIVLPITKSIIITKGFDTIIKEKYKEKFPQLNGVLIIDNNNGDKLPVVGKEYYNEFGYVFNPIYKQLNYENEFYDIANLTKRIYSTSLKFKFLEMKTDDEHIYEHRKNFNFSLLKK